MARPANPKTPFAQRLVSVRGARSREDFARAMGLNERTYANYERGDNEPDLTFLARMIELEAVSAHWLLTGEGEMRRPFALAEKTVSTDQVRKLVWNIAATFWEELPSRTKSFDVADQFVEMFDYLISRQNVKDDAASEVIQFGVERLKRTSARDDS